MQPDLAAGTAQQAEHLGDAPLVDGRLVAVPAVGVPGDHEERGVDAARVLAGQHLREGPVRVGASRQVMGQPVRHVAGLARQRSQVEAAQAAQAAVAAGGEPAPGPAPEVVDVVGQGDGEAGAAGPGFAVALLRLPAASLPLAPHPARRRQRRQAELREARRQHRAQQRRGAIDRRLVDAQGRVLGEDRGGERQAAEAVTLGVRALVPGGEEDERRGDEIERGAEARPPPARSAGRRAARVRRPAGERGAPGRRRAARRPTSRSARRSRRQRRVAAKSSSAVARGAPSGPRRPARRVGERAAGGLAGGGREPRPPAESGQQRAEHPLGPRPPAAGASTKTRARAVTRSARAALRARPSGWAGA